MKKLLTVVLAFTLCVSFALATNNGNSIVYVTKTGKSMDVGKRYHLAGCTETRSTSPQMTLEQAIQDGYKACEICHPGYWNGISTEQVQSEQEDFFQKVVVISVGISVSVSAIMFIASFLFMWALSRKILRSNESLNKKLLEKIK